MLNTEFSAKDSLINFKDDLIKSKKYWGICLVLIIIAFFSTMNVKNYSHPEIEVGILILLSLMSVFTIAYYQGHRDDKNFYKTVFVVILLFGIVFSVMTPIMSTHDEIEHFVRAEITSNGVINPEYNDTPFYLEGIRYDGSYQTIQSTYDLTQAGKIQTFINYTMVNRTYVPNLADVATASDYIRMDMVNSSTQLSHKIRFTDILHRQ